MRAGLAKREPLPLERRGSDRQNLSATSEATAAFGMKSPIILSAASTTVATRAPKVKATMPRHVDQPLDLLSRTKSSTLTLATIVPKSCRGRVHLCAAGSGRIVTTADFAEQCSMSRVRRARSASC